MAQAAQGQGSPVAIYQQGENPKRQGLAELVVQTGASADPAHHHIRQVVCYLTRASQRLDEQA